MGTPPAFSAPVATGNSAPVISGDAAAYAQVGVPYEFQPTANDPDGDSLTFSATNLPPWASFNATNGKISGMPGESDPGVYETITIAVADATHTTATDPFSITVLGDGNGVAGLEWAAPTYKVDGSPLDDLAGFRILYGRDADDLDHSIWIASPSASSYEFATLAAGTWYFAVVAVSTSGLEGPATTPAMKAI